MWRTKFVRLLFIFFFFQAEDGIRDLTVTGVQTCALPILHAIGRWHGLARSRRAGDEEQAGERVHSDGADEADARALGTPAPPSHRSTTSGSATRPTSFTPAARIAASTCTTSA